MTADTFSPPSGAGAPAAPGPGATAASPGAGSGMAPSPGTVFARAFAADGDRTEVTFDYTITEAHKPAREKPRLTVRSLLKKRPVDAEVITYWREGRPTEEEAAAVPESADRREAGFRFGVAQAQIRPIRAWVQIPPELAADPEMLAEFIDHRLLVRLATAENQALSIGPYGLLSHPEIARLPYHGDYVDGLLAACDEIEQTGSTAHAIIVNPRDYYRVLVGHGSLLADLAANGILISRIRWVRPGQALAGDFAEAVRLLDARRSAIRVAKPPPGTFARPGLAVCAEINEGLAVHLPTHFFLAIPAGETEANA
jgi:hypothetical protein